MFTKMKIVFWLGWVHICILHFLNIYQKHSVTNKFGNFYSFLRSFFLFCFRLFYSPLDKWFLITDQLCVLVSFYVFGVAFLFFVFYLSVFVRFWSLIYTFCSRLMEFAGIRWISFFSTFAILCAKFIHFCGIDSNKYFFLTH